MKSITSKSPAYSGLYGNSGKITKQRRDIENEEIQLYLSKLKELVPFMPKNRRLSKLEVIQYVIDYIGELQEALEAHPTINSAAVQSAAAAMFSSTNNNNSNSITVAPVHRQPLSILPPNSNLHASCTENNTFVSTRVIEKQVNNEETRIISSC